MAAAGTIGSAIQLRRSTMPKNIALEARLDPQVTMFTNATQVQQAVTHLGDSAALSPDEARAAGFRVVLQTPMSLAVLAESLHRALLERTTV